MRGDERVHIQRAVDGIVMVHTDDKAVIPAIRAANAAGVPIIHFNRPPASKPYETVRKPGSIIAVRWSASL